MAFAPDEQTLLAGVMVDRSPGTGPLGVREYPRGYSGGMLAICARMDEQVVRTGDLVGLMFEEDMIWTMVVVRADREVEIQPEDV